MAVPTVRTSAISPSATDGPAPMSAAAREKVKQLAQEFESLLMGQMMKEMRKSMLSDDEGQETGFGAANMTEMMDTALGAALTRAGGFGLTDVMLRGLDRQFPTAGAHGAFEPVVQDLSPAPRLSPAAPPVASSPALPVATSHPTPASLPVTQGGAAEAAPPLVAPDGRVS